MHDVVVMAVTNAVAAATIASQIALRILGFAIIDFNTPIFLVVKRSPFQGS